MNPFTRFLLGNKKKDDEALEAFVDHWDTLEALVIRVFKGKLADSADESEYEVIRKWLAENYALWQNELGPYWQKTRAAGQPTGQDPFLRILSAERAREFVGDWEAMQHLPAARETLNRYIQAIEGSDDEK